MEQIETRYVLLPSMTTETTIESLVRLPLKQIVFFYLLLQSCVCQSDCLAICWTWNVQQWSMLLVAFKVLLAGNSMWIGQEFSAMHVYSSNNTNYNSEMFIKVYKSYTSKVLFWVNLYQGSSGQVFLNQECINTEPRKSEAVWWQKTDGRFILQWTIK